MLDMSKNYKIVESKEKDGVLFEVLELENLNGATSPDMAEKLYFAKQQGLHIRFIKATLNDAKLKTEAGALYYYKGDFKTNIDVKGFGGLIKKSIVGSLTNESVTKPEYYGSGEIVLEPSFKHYLLLELNNSEIIIDKGLFYASTGNINISAAIQGNLSSAAMGGEGLFQIKLSGTGIVVLECDVPKSEIQEIELNNETLKVDGNFAILRSSSVKFSVTKSNKGLISSAMGGEGFLNTFNGNGLVWLAPTKPLYTKLEYGIPLCNKGNHNRDK